MLNPTPASRYAGVLAMALTLCACDRAQKNPAVVLAPPPAAEASHTGVLECTGVLHPAGVFALRIKPGEFVDKVSVHAGDDVPAGEVLATLSCPALQTEWLATHNKIVELRHEATQLDALRWKKSVAESRLAALQRPIAAAEALRGKVAGYDPQVQAAELMGERTRVVQEVEGLAREIAAGVLGQQAATPLLHAVEQRVLQLDAQIAKLVVRAPWRGVVVRVESAPAADGTLLELHDRAHFNVQGLLWQNQLAAVKLGSRVTVLPDFIPGCCWTGTVRSIGLAAVPDATQSFPRFPVTVALADGPDTASLRDGMTVFMQIHPVEHPVKAP